MSGQCASVEGNLTAVENLTMIADLHRLVCKKARRRAHGLVSLFGLLEAAPWGALFRPLTDAYGAKSFVTIG